MVAGAVPAIPWAHSTDDFGSVWVWDTPHFIVTVNGNDRSYYYTIADKSAAAPGATKVLSDGQAATFMQAETMIRSTIGKSYHPGLGYLPFAGSLATTFLLANGQETDLGPYVGARVDVTVLQRDGTRETHTGIAKVQHYDLLLEQPAGTLRISPSFVVDIRLVGSRQPTVATVRLNRTYPGRVTPGCTGVAGFIADTVDHHALTCPIHEENRS